MSVTVDEIYALLPAIYRTRDAEQGLALRQVLEIIAAQVNLVDEDIARLYDNWFIETADEWLVPYIGELLGVRNLHTISAAGFTQRARVANTLRYRRRKGTATMLEQLARDTTLWAARAVEFFQLLGVTQYLNHLRPANDRTPDLRDVNRLQLLNTPFDSIAHTAEVRRIASARGKYNIPNVGIFLWRLQSYAIDRGMASPAANPPDGRYFFSPLGANLALFNLPATETTITHLAEEYNVPAPIRPLALLFDLQQYRDQALPFPPDKRPKGSGLFGPPDPDQTTLCEASASLNIEIGNPSTPLNPLDVICMDLSQWSRPPVRIRAALSGDLSTFPALSSPSPEVRITIGSSGPYTAALAAVPANLEEAAGLLETAIRSSGPEALFRGAAVISAGERLCVIPGDNTSDVVFTATAGDPNSVTELALASIQNIDAARSARLSPFTGADAGRLNLTIGAIGPRKVFLSSAAHTLDEARKALEDGIHNADPGPEFQQARVMILEDCLLVIPGGAGGPLTFEPVAEGSVDDDSATVYHLGLNQRVAVDVRNGRLAFPLGISPQNVRVSYHYGFPGDLGSGPYDRKLLISPGQNLALLPAYTNTVAEPFGLDQLFQVGENPIYSGLTLYNTLNAALLDWSSSSAAVIEIEDNRTYQEDIDLTLNGRTLVIQAANLHRPALLGKITVHGQGRLVLNGLLIAGQIQVADTLPPDTGDPLYIDLVHCTLAPGWELQDNGAPRHPAEPSLIAGPDEDNLAVSIDHTISGPLQLPPGALNFTARDSIIDAPLRGSGAYILPALVSGQLQDPPAWTRIPRLQVTIGDLGPVPVSLPKIPKTLEETRQLLEEALHNAAVNDANPQPAFIDARVFLHTGRLVILPGISGQVMIQNLAGGASADDLKLSPSAAAAVFALISGPIAQFPLSAVQPRLTARIEGLHTPALDAGIALTPTPANLIDLPQALEDALHNAGTGQPAYDQSLVLPLQTGSGANCLVVLPGQSDVTLRFSAPAADPTTLTELALAADGFALAATRSGEQPGPISILERTTVLGPVHVKRLELASEVIFDSPVQVDFRQEGCVRFSFVPPGSRTPRRFHCQPDLALVEAANNAERARILERLRPYFTSTRYGLAAYTQLSDACPLEIRTGAEDGSEMGVWSFLKQPQREANLRASLDEYLRFGLEAGLFFVS